MFQNVQQIQDFIRQNGIAFLDFKMIDLRGRWKHLSIPAARFNEDIMTHGIGFDGSNYGYAQVERSDMVFLPDITTAVVDPFVKAPTLTMIGDVMVIDDSNDLLAVVENLLSFFVHESCGKCTPCREGNMRLLQTIRKIRNGYGRPDHIELLEDLCLAMTKASLCGLGQSFPIPVLSSLHNFRDIYETAIQRGHQP